MRESGPSARESRRPRTVRVAGQGPRLLLLPDWQVGAHPSFMQPVRSPVVIIDGLNVARSMPYHTTCVAPLCPSLPSAHDLTCARSPCPRHGSICSGRSDLLSIAIDHFVERGFEVHAILPRWAMDGGRSRSEANKLLDANRFLTRYIERGQLHLAPAGVDDDDFVLSFALETAGAFILTNDLYRDHVAKDRVTRSWLDERLMAFMFVLDDISASGARRHRLLVPSHTFGQQQPPPPCPASTAMTTETLEAAGQNRPTRASSPSAESSSSTRTLVTVAPGQRVVRRLGFASSGAASPKKALAAVTKHTRTPIRCRGRQGSGPSMKELLARPKQFDRRF